MHQKSAKDTHTSIHVDGCVICVLARTQHILNIP